MTFFFPEEAKVTLTPAGKYLSIIKKIKLHSDSQCNRRGQKCGIYKNDAFRLGII